MLKSPPFTDSSHDERASADAEWKRDEKLTGSLALTTGTLWISLVGVPQRQLLIDAPVIVRRRIRADPSLW
jgi:hypothetical protein